MHGTPNEQEILAELVEGQRKRLAELEKEQRKDIEELEDEQRKDAELSERLRTDLSKLTRNPLDSLGETLGSSPKPLPEGSEEARTDPGHSDETKQP